MTDSISPRDTELDLEGLRRLDPQIVTAVYDRYFPDIYRYVQYRLGDRNQAEDIVSEVFVRLLEAVEKKRGPRKNLKGWLLSTASHMINDHFRRSYRRPTDSLDEALPDRGNSPVEQVERRAQADQFRVAYRRLTPDQQHVLALRFGDGYSLDETADIMGKKVNAIKALQFRALAALQRLIEEPDRD